MIGNELVVEVPVPIVTVCAQMLVNIPSITARNKIIRRLRFIRISLFSFVKSIEPYIL